MPQQGSFPTRDVVTTSPTRSSVIIGSACQSELYLRWRHWCIVHCMVPHQSAPSYLASSFTCVADMPHRRRLRSVFTEQLDVPTCQRLCLSCCWSKGVEWPAKRCYVGLVAASDQEQAEDILVPPLLRNCLTLNYVSCS